MTLLGDSIKRWCQEESLAVTTEPDDEAGRVCTVLLPGEPPLSVGVAAGPAAARTVLACAFDLPIPQNMAADPQAPQQIARVLERVAASRAGLVECRPAAAAGKPAAEIAVTLHEDGMNKQTFLSALEEIRKIARVIAWELEGLSASTEVLAEVQAIVEQAGAFASEAATAAEVRPPVAEPPPPPPPPPAPTPAPPAAPAAPAGVFCSTCGRQARPGARFCTGCGATLEG
jgi:hypothetical protein